jgi:hypothetical protein
VQTSTQLDLPESYPVDRAHAEAGDANGPPLHTDDDNGDYDVHDNHDNNNDENDQEYPQNLSNIPADIHDYRSHSYTLPSTSLGISNSASSAPIAHYDDSESEDDSEDDSDGDVEDSKRRLLARMAKYKSQRDTARQQRDEGAAHAVLAGRHIQSLQAKLNAKNDKRGRGRVVVIGSRITTTQEGRAEAAKQKALRQERVQKAAESQRKKQDAQTEMHVRRAQEGRAGMTFTGALNSQKRPTLQNIAWSLQLSEDGTRDELINRIKTHFDSNQHLCEDVRYSGLFGKRASRRQDATIPIGVPEPTLPFADSTNMLQADGVHHSPIAGPSYVPYPMPFTDSHAHSYDFPHPSPGSIIPWPPWLQSMSPNVHNAL